MELGWSSADAELESVRAIVATAEMAIEEIARLYPEHVRLTISLKGNNLGQARVSISANRRRVHDV